MFLTLTLITALQAMATVYLSVQAVDISDLTSNQQAGKKITNKVRDNTRNSFPGVYVVIKGTSRVLFSYVAGFLTRAYWLTTNENARYNERNEQITN